MPQKLPQVSPDSDVRIPEEQAEMSSITFPLVAWRSNMEQWKGRMFTFHKFEIKNSIPGEACQWEWEEGCSCKNNEVSADMNESHEQSLGRQLVANFPKKKQTFQTINGLIVWIKFKHNIDLLLEALSTWFHYEFEKSGGAVWRRLLHHCCNPASSRCLDSLAAGAARV